MTRAIIIGLIVGLAGLLFSISLTRGPGPSAPNVGPVVPSPTAASGPRSGTAPPPEPAHLQSAPKRAVPVLEKEPPQRAKVVLAEIQKRHGEPPPGYVGGRTFQNREGKLPRGIYREYDVNPRVPGRNRGPERIVIEQRTGKAYYTDDHYQEFIPMN